MKFHTKYKEISPLEFHKCEENIAYFQEVKPCKVCGDYTNWVAFDSYTHICSEECFKFEKIIRGL